ncbi:hypothetical protein L596_012708 [Steinernema carpocapsae]|uniref:Uncharacterized protein n=1 Tax=Steinernema carpocapsae TaxID=34508 RepID=A0A4U5NXX4_STECR|nr:hypothetical protein L596_012708 [Steinernema carpocapsae]
MLIRYIAPCGPPKPVPLARFPSSFQTALRRRQCRSPTLALVRESSLRALIVTAIDLYSSFVHSLNVAGKGHVWSFSSAFFVESGKFLWRNIKESD